MLVLNQTDYSASSQSRDYVLLASSQKSWQELYDFDGDKKADQIRASFSGGAHCCYRISINSSSLNRVIDFPFEMDGGYVGGLDLSNPNNFYVKDFDNDGRPELYMRINSYNGRAGDIPEEWQKRYGITSNQILIDFANGGFVVSDFRN